MTERSSLNTYYPSPPYPARIFAIVKKREDAYCRFLKNPPRDPQELFSIKKKLAGRFLRLNRLMQSFRRLRFFQSDAMQSFLLTYLSSIKDSHRENCLWIAVYCDLSWPLEISGNKKERQKWQLSYANNHDEAEGKWASLMHYPSPKALNNKLLRKIISLKTKMDSFPVNSAPWRHAFHNLTKEVFNLILFQFQASDYAIRNKFQLTLSAQTILAQIENDPKQDTVKETRLKERITDWLRGYMPQRPEYATAALKALATSLNRAYGSWRRHQGLKIVGAIGVIVTAILLMNHFLSLSQWDDRLLRHATFQIKRLFRMDPFSIAMRQKKELLQNRIINIKNDYSTEGIRDAIKTFYTSVFETREEGYLYFAEKILKGFLLLLSDWNVDDSLKGDVLAAAEYFDPELVAPLENIMALYASPVIHEKDLRKDMLKLRGVFLRNRVMPFMFLALENDIPYIFLFSEKILIRYSLLDAAVANLGLQGDYYKNRFYCFLVQGDAYPFNDRAGYFEGQFAVAFKKYAQKYEWTVRHEIGHVIDFLRNQYEGEPLPVNVESHAMLFPLIWADDRKDYLQQRLVPEALRADADNYYSQAAKGILNGLLLQLKEADPQIKAPLITNRFEQDRITKIYEFLLPVETMTLKAMAYRVYKEKDKYLATAQAGRYVSFVSNVEEIIYGTDHPIAQQGFLLGGAGFGGLRNGPRFIRDNDSDIPFNIFAFLRSVFYIIFMGERSFGQATHAEAFVAAFFVFFFFNAFMFLLQKLSAPYRKKMFYGSPVTEIISDIYRKNPWSSGLSWGQEINELTLLKKIYRSEGDIKGDLKQEVVRFKSIADKKKRALFDLCLLFAPFNPSKSAIKNKAHDLLFFLPFLGPFLGRAPWIWPVQRHFHAREQYNKKVAQIAYHITEKTSSRELLSKLSNPLNLYAAHAHEPPRHNQQTATNFDMIKKHVAESFMKGGLSFHTNVKFIEDRFTLFQEEAQEFDRLDYYTPGDDIRRIDWKASLRTPQQQTYVRRYNYPYGIKLGLWLDMRHTHSPEGQKQWAEDFVKAMNLLNEDGLLERFIFIMPNGFLHECVVNMRIYRKHVEMIEKILKEAQSCYKNLEHQLLQIDFNGFNFYDSTENKKFTDRITLTDFRQGAQDIQWKPLHAKRLNIFIIGAKIHEQSHIESLLGETNKMFFVRV